MQKPKPGAPAVEWAAYRAWVRTELENWDPADDRGSPAVYVPRYDGIKALEVERAERERDDEFIDDVYADD